MNSVWRSASCVLVSTLLLVGAARADAPTGRYMAGSGTVLDSKTGLTWEQPASTAKVGWTDARSYCTNKGTSWRLPTVKELLSLVDFGKTMSSTSAMIDAMFTGTQTDLYWASTVVPGSPPSMAWYVAFDDGHASNIDMTVMVRVRCVR